MVKVAPFDVWIPKIEVAVPLVGPPKGTGPRSVIFSATEGVVTRAVKRGFFSQDGAFLTSLLVAALFISHPLRCVLGPSHQNRRPQALTMLSLTFGRGLAEAPRHGMRTHHEIRRHCVVMLIRRRRSMITVRIRRTGKGMKALTRRNQVIPNSEKKRPVHWKCAPIYQRPRRRPPLREEEAHIEKRLREEEERLREVRRVLDERDLRWAEACKDCDGQLQRSTLGTCRICRHTPFDERLEHGSRRLLTRTRDAANEWDALQNRALTDLRSISMIRPGRLDQTWPSTPNRAQF